MVDTNTVAKALNLTPTTTFNMIGSRISLTFDTNSNENGYKFSKKTMK